VLQDQIKRSSWHAYIIPYSHTTCPKLWSIIPRESTLFLTELHHAISMKRICGHLHISQTADNPVGQYYSGLGSLHPNPGCSTCSSFRFTWLTNKRGTMFMFACSMVFGSTSDRCRSQPRVQHIKHQDKSIQHRPLLPNQMPCR